jgi:hypothetical protein
MLFNTFPMTVLKFALAVEQVTTQKKANLILNVDGCIAVYFVDMMQSCGAFQQCGRRRVSQAWVPKYAWTLHGLFCYFDQKRLKQGL